MEHFFYHNMVCHKPELRRGPGPNGSRSSQVMMTASVTQTRIAAVSRTVLLGLGNGAISLAFMLSGSARDLDPAWPGKAFKFQPPPDPPPPGAADGRF